MTLQWHDMTPSELEAAVGGSPSPGRRNRLRMAVPLSSAERQEAVRAKQERLARLAAERAAAKEAAENAEVKSAPDTKVKVSQMEKGVSVVRTDTPTNLRFEVDNQTHKVLQFTIDLEGSRGIHFDDYSLKKTALCVPGTRTLLGNVACNPRGGWQLKAGYAWQTAPAAALRDMCRENAATVLSEVKAFRAHRLGLDGHESMPVRDVISQCRRDGVRFVDLDFPPDGDSLYEPGSPQDQEAVWWRRVSDIFDPELIEIVLDGVEPEDIQQSRLGDCWLLAALAAIAEFPEEINNLLCSDEGLTQRYNSEGVYEVTLYKNGQRVRVRLDDFVPCVPGAGPMYSRSSEGELWVMLVEKAFAKLHGSYQALGGGLARDALMDLTGCPTLTLQMKETGAEEMWATLCKHDNLNNAMCASVPGQDRWSCTNDRQLGGPGLVSGHGYSVLRTAETSGGDRLVRLRNPWGSFEWKGAWSDQDARWTASVRAEVGLEDTEVADDGSFWMSLNDFAASFDHVTVCCLHASDGSRWYDKRGKTRVVLADGGVEGGMMRFRVTVAGEAWITVHQMDERVEFVAQHIDLASIVLRVDAAGTLEYVAAAGGDYVREAQAYVPHLDAGEYLVVPFTSGLVREEDVHQRVRNTTQLKRVVDDDGRLTDAYLALVGEVFSRYDANMSGFVSVSEGQDLFGKLEGHSSPMVSCARLSWDGDIDVCFVRAVPKWYGMLYAFVCVVDAQSVFVVRCSTCRMRVQPKHSCGSLISGQDRA